MSLAESGKPAGQARCRHAYHQVHGLGVTRACGLTGISRSLYRYEPRRPDDDALRTRLCELAAFKCRYGYRRLHVLVKREGWAVNHKRLSRVYREAGLAVRRRKRKRIAGIERQMKAPSLAPDQSWPMDFVSDGLADGLQAALPEHRRRLYEGVFGHRSGHLATGKSSGRCAGTAGRAAWLAAVNYRRQRAGIRRQGARRVGLPEGIEAALHRARQAAAERLYRKLQRQVQG